MEKRYLVCTHEMSLVEHPDGVEVPEEIVDEYYRFKIMRAKLFLKLMPYHAEHAWDFLTKKEE